MNFFSPQWTLLFGIILSLFIRGSVTQDRAKIYSSLLLQLSVILLGASLNFNAVLNQGGNNALITFISILSVFILGYALRKAFKIESDQGLLITTGTAICGGSAIGALSPVIKADSMAITVSIAVVFLLNAVALYIFPIIGHWTELTQDQFGLWAALAIHDTSSVVAASSIYGKEALEVATTTKLIRALWIIPITFFFSFYSKKASKGSVSIPWFIFGFLMVSMFFTFTNIPTIYKTTVTSLAKYGFSLTLFLIGLTFDFTKIKTVGPKPLFMGITLWVIVSSLSLFLIKIYH
jgi:uncharacterized integral membrane protein (TIGR00698 family)